MGASPFSLLRRHPEARPARLRGPHGRAQRGPGPGAGGTNGPGAREAGHHGQYCAARARGTLASAALSNAGASFIARLEEISLNGWNAVVGIKLNGTFLGCKWAGKQMVRQGGGVIINVASIAGIYGSTGMPHYGAARAAVINLTRTLGSLWARHHVRVNCIAPGPVGTQGYLDNLYKANPKAEEVYEGVAARVGMGRASSSPRMLRHS